MFHHNNKTNALRQRQLNSQSSHSLIYSIGQYRKSVTNLAIGCIRKQSLITIEQKHQQPHHNINKIRVDNNKQNPITKQQMRIKSTTSHSNSIPTKKKRYNYGITLQSSINQNQHQQHQNFMNSTLGHNREDNNNNKIKGYKNNKQGNYLTKPFSISEKEEINRKSLSSLGLMMMKDTDNKHSYKNLSVIQYNNYNDKQQYFITTNGNINNQKQTKDSYYKSSKKSKEKQLPLFDKININKQSISLHRPSQAEKNNKQFSKPKQQNTVKLNIKQQTKQQSSSSSSINYPKTQTYTSRSDYNIQKLTNKLDSYIKKHIKHF